MKTKLRGAPAAKRCMGDLGRLFPLLSLHTSPPLSGAQTQYFTARGGVRGKSSAQ